MSEPEFKGDLVLRFRDFAGWKVTGKQRPDKT